MPRVELTITASETAHSHCWSLRGGMATANGIQSGSGPAMARLEGSVAFPFPSRKLLAGKRQTNPLINFPRIIYNVLSEEAINS